MSHTDKKSPPVNVVVEVAHNLRGVGGSTLKDVLKDVITNTGIDATSISTYDGNSDDVVRALLQDEDIDIPHKTIVALTDVDKRIENHDTAIFFWDGHDETILKHLKAWNNSDKAFFEVRMSFMVRIYNVGTPVVTDDNGEKRTPSGLVVP